MAEQYWLDLFTGSTWKEFLAAGGDVSGFRESRWAIVKRLRPGHRLLCYLTGLSRFIAVLEVTSEPFRDESPIWKDEIFPSRVRVRSLVTLAPETAVPISELRERLSIFENLKSPQAWTGHLRGSPAHWKESDGNVVLAALHEAAASPVVRPADPRMLARRPPRSIETVAGPITVPEPDTLEPALSEPVPTAHTEIQFRLLKLGVDMGFAVWVARNDRSRTFEGKPFSEWFSLKETLPLNFDEGTMRTVELIDVLWIKANAIVAAFEVESTTSVYSGLLRMSDLLAMQPNLNIPIYLVAPVERRNKVLLEVSRPTFSRMNPPLAEVCRFISFETLNERLKEFAAVLRYLKPEFLEEVAEDCLPDSA